MRVIISPAKKMRVDQDFSPSGTPVFLEDTRVLLSTLQDMSDDQLQKLWKCNDDLAKLNVERIRNMDLDGLTTPAVVSYEGIQYQYMAPGVMEQKQLDWLQDHLRILSGFYGVLKPFDGVIPYRLEMQAKLRVGESKDLYHFWNDRLERTLAAETDCILNLASKEYSKAVEPYLPVSCRFITVSFVEWKGDKLVEKGTACKMARGQMVRWMAEHHIEDPEAVRDFNELEYSFSPDRSGEKEFVFIKGGH